MNENKQNVQKSQLNNRTANSTQQKGKRGIAKVLLPLFIIGVLVCAVIIITDMSRKKKAEDTYDDLQQQVNVTTQADDVSGTEPAAETVTATTEVDKLEELGITVPVSAQ